MRRRTCAHCGAYLRSTNPESLCAPCDLTESRVALERLARERQAGERRRSEYLRLCGKKETVTSAILRALPGTAAEVAEAVGHPHEQTRKILSKLATAGVIERDRARGNGHVPIRYSVPATDVERLVHEPAA